MRRFLIPGLLVLLLLLLAGLSGCGPASTAHAGPADTPSPTPTEVVPHHQFADTVQVGPWQITPEYMKRLAPDSLVKVSKPGDVFLVIVMTITNSSSDPQTINRLTQFQLHDTVGTAYEAAKWPEEGLTNFATGPKYGSHFWVPIDGNVAMGSSQRGVVPFEIPQPMPQLLLSFHVPGATPSQAVWELPVY
jgi:hypothetical protein